ncbi:subclass B3 metallo-beta-lactamase [Sphingomonas parva]|uniref:beta-lactamase n=1 Tax=Sphingomonas parva TaxID=2555898 RepID=A0A4Y8ZQ71_9SPHN|nr:subclass B3 metallo-beta-lactamase [Sphingomonas parva]TFI56989.1 subclass B3 metallo-beta-lactamase [Sphingomonas parva]
MRYLVLALSAALLAIPAAGAAQDSAQRREWNRPAAPFRIADNLYYVGTQGLAAYLITDPAGHVLIDGGLPESAPLIAGNIRSLGFRLADVKYLLINHAHADHSGGLAELKRRSGARLVASAGDKADLESGRVAGRPEIFAGPPVRVDRVVGDGEMLRLGGTALTANLTPGHTRGCTSWSLQTKSGTILFACSLTVAGQNLLDDPTYPDAAADFRRTFARLKAMRADMFLNFHPEFFDLDGKRARQRAGEASAFIDPGELQRQVARAEAAFEAELARQQAAAKPRH